MRNDQHPQDGGAAAGPMPRTTGDAPSSAAFQTYYNSVRLELLDLLAGFRPRRALEVGCAGAANLSMLKQRFPDCHTVGVEQDADAANLARRSAAADEIIVADASSIELEPGAFDLIILSHVLEHLDDPALLLKRVQRWATPGARLLVALPNVRHYSVLVDLVARGDFRYREHGILDKTHLRFFTRRSALRLFEEQGLQVIACKPEVAGRLSRLMSAASLGTADEFAAFAYNFFLRRANPCGS